MKRILLVDDETGILHALERQLRGRYEIEGFADPAEALRRCRDAAFDLAIADYQMPQMSGVQFLRRFREIQPDAARILLSGQADVNALAGAINETHVYRFIAKPWDADALLNSIDQALAFRDVLLESRRLAETCRGRPGEPPAAGNGRPSRILLVDGDEHELALMAEALLHTDDSSLYGAMQEEIASVVSAAGHGFRFAVDTFTGSADALAQAAQTPYDLVICAQTLADSGGIAFLSEFRKIRPDAVRIMTSDHPDEATLARAINEAQVTNFLYGSWKSPELKADARRRYWNTYKLRLTVMQALATREVLGENRRLAAARPAG